jgi:4-hydroxy-tetrahydrodipicolinate synthase
MARVQEIQQSLIAVHKAMFCETNPGPVKYASKLMGLTTGELRLPLVEISDESKAKVEAALKGVGLIR